MFLRQIVELPLHVERADRLAVFEIDNPVPGRIARNVARALDGIVQDEISWQTAFFEQRRARKPSCRSSARSRTGSCSNRR